MENLKSTLDTRKKDTMPDYSQLSSGPSFDGSDIGDEEELLASFDSSKQNSSTNTFHHWRNWLARKCQQQDNLQESWILFQQFRSCLIKNAIVIHCSLFFIYSLIYFLVIYRSSQVKGYLPLIYSRFLLHGDRDMLTVIHHSACPRSHFL